MDCDAFSFILSYKEDSAQKRIAVKRLLKHFGSEWTAVTFPPAASAIQTAKTGNQDSLFGSHHSKSCTNDIKSALHLGEVLIIDTPVKIALHSSCKEAVKNSISKLGYSVTLTSSHGLCFNHAKSTNKPCYGQLIDVIFESCYVPSLNTHVIHIGNVGMRHSVNTAVHSNQGIGGCPLQKLFSLIQNVRDHGILVETTQLDIAFNIKSHELLQWCASEKKNSRERKISRKSTLSNSFPEVWPIHSLVSKEGGGLAAERHQRGTLRVKRRNNDKSGAITILEGAPQNHDDFSYEDHFGDDDPCMQLLRQIYSCDQQCSATFSISEKLVMFLSAIYSIKLYSTLAHFLTPHKYQLPIKLSTMKYLPSCSMIKIQRYLQCMETLTKNSLEQLNENGIHARLEVSIRPGVENDTTNSDGARLRSEGHLVDLLSHVLVGLYDVLNHSKYKIELATVSPRRVYTESLFLVRTVRSVVNLRSESQFDKVHSHPKSHIWLQALMCLIMTKIGFAHHFKLSKIMQWLDSDDMFDPGEIGYSLKNGFPLRIMTQQTPESDQSRSPALSPSDASIQHLSQLLHRASMSEEGIHTIIAMVCSKTPSFRVGYQQLSLMDKLILAQNMSDFIIPHLSILLTQPNMDVDTRPCKKRKTTWEADSFCDLQSDESEFDPNQKDESVWKFNEDIFEHMDWHHSYYKNYDEYWAREHLHLLHQHNSQDGLRFRSVSDISSSVTSVIVALQNFNMMFDPRSPTYIYQLLHYIDLCHERSMEIPTLPNRISRQLQPFPHSTLKSYSLVSRLHNFLQFSTEKQMFLMEVFSELKIRHPPNVSTDSMIATLSQHYLFPCSLAKYDILLQSQPSSSDDSHTKAILKNLNFLVHHSVNKVFVHRLSSSDTSVSRYFRSIDQVYISIKKPSELLRRDDTSFTEQGTRHTDLFQALQEMFNTKHSLKTKKGIRDYLHEFIAQQDLICDNYLTSDGNNDSSLRNVITLSQLCDKLGFHISEKSTENPSIITNYHPEMILPIAALLFKCHVLFLNHDRSSTLFHYYHSRTNKIITYKFKDRVNMTSKVDCFVLHMISNTFQSSQFSLHTDIGNPHDTDILFPRSLHVIIPTLKKHPVGKMRTMKNVPSCILGYLQTPELNLSQFENYSKRTIHDNDPFTIHPYLEELSSFSYNMDDVLDRNIVLSITSLGANSLRRISQYLKCQQNMDKPEYFKVLCPILSLKYKLWFSVWHECSTGRNSGGTSLRTTYLYCFHPLLKKVVSVQLPQFVFMKYMKFIIYIRVLEKDSRLPRFNYWGLHQDNPYHVLSPPNASHLESDLLLCPFSYLDGNIRRTVMNNIKRSHGNVCLLDVSEHSPLPPSDEETTPVTVLSYITSIHNELIDHIVLAVFPFHTERRCYPVICSHSQSIDQELVRHKVTDIMSVVLRDSISQTIYLHLHTYDHDRELSTSFYQILYGFLIGSSTSIKEFRNRVQRIQTETMLPQKTKAWISELCVTHMPSLIQFPIWLRQLLD